MLLSMPIDIMFEVRSIPLAWISALNLVMLSGLYDAFAQGSTLPNPDK